MKILISGSSGLIGKSLINFLESKKVKTSIIEKFSGKKAKIKKKGMQLGDVRYTYANIQDSKKDLQFRPQTNLEEGLEKFVNWYKEYHKVN